MRGASASRVRANEGSEASADPRARLIVVSGPAAGRELALGRPRMLLGRDSEADLVLADVSLSKLHALFLRTSQGYQVQDLESANGTWVNGVRTEIALLQPGDRIALGEHVLQYAVDPPG